MRFGDSGILAILIQAHVSAEPDNPHGRSSMMDVCHSLTWVLGKREDTKPPVWIFDPEFEEK